MAQDTDPGKSTNLVLTPRQEQMVGLLAEGLSNEEIAAQLGITLGTVKQHLVLLYRRLGVSSRTKAVLAAGRLARARPHDKALKTSKPQRLASETSEYGWRMVCVVAIYVSDGPSSDPTQMIARDRYLTQMRDAIERYAIDLDGRFASMPYGGLLAWFGHPTAHTDDADRAVSLASFAHRCAQHYANQQQQTDGVQSSLGQVGVAVASRAEIVAYDAAELLGAEGFRSAAILARYASSLGVPLVDDVTHRLAPLSVSWMTVRFQDKQPPEQLKRLGALFSIGTHNQPRPDARQGWGGLAFLSDILATARSGVAQWLSIECWPSTVGVSVTDAVSNAALAEGFNILRVRLPSSNMTGKLEQSVLAQILNQCKSDPDLSLSDTELVVSAETLVGELTRLSALAPLVVAVYGPNGLDRLVHLLGASGTETLVSKPIVIIGASLADAEQPQTSVRLLGPRPVKSMLSRVFTLRTPVLEDLSDQVKTGLQELLDGLSNDSRSLVIRTAASPKQGFLSVAKTLKLTDAQLKDSFNELAVCGLVVPTPSDARFQFRSPATAQAIKLLTVLPAKASGNA
jgi:DNA-binding CsgD family transcriptional regulator